MRPTSAWSYIDTARGRVCAVRAHTSPLVELRLRWDHPDTQGRALAAYWVLAERLMDLASSCRSGTLATSHLTAHANPDRFGIAASCWRDQWSHLLRAVLAQLAEGLITDQEIASLAARATNYMPHRRDGLDTIADHECLHELLAGTGVPSTRDSTSGQAELTATDIRTAQHSLWTTAPLLVLVGDLDPESSAELAASLLGRVHAEPALVSPVHSGASEVARHVWYTTTRRERSAWRLAAIVPSRQREREVAETVAHLLGDPSAGLLPERLRHQLGWSYDVRCQIDDRGPWRVLMCKAIVASRNADRAGAEMRAIVDVRLAEHVQRPGVVEEAHTAVAASRLLLRSNPTGWASELVKTLAAGVHAADAVGAAEHARSVSPPEVGDFIKSHLASTGQEG